MTSFGLKDDDQKLLEKGILDITGGISDKTAVFVKKAMLFLKTIGDPDLMVWISSQGGQCRAAFFIYDMIATYPGKTTGRVVGEAGSMAPVILQACEIRESLKHSTIWLHSIGKRFGYDDFADPDRAEKALKSLEKNQSRTVRILSQRTKKDPQEIQKLLKTEPELTADEALKLGLLDKIVEETFPSE